MELSCDEEGMTYSLALCPLAGLTPDMLQFQNSSCSLTEFPSGPEDTIDITVAYGDCGMAQEVTVLRCTLREHTSRKRFARFFPKKFTERTKD